MDFTRDGNGKTESEFLREYDITKYFRPSVTVDAAIVCRGKGRGKVLLIRRGGHPYLGDWAFPGGFVEKDESCEAAVLRELEEETGINGVPLRQLVTVSTPERDPRWRNITTVYYACLDKPVNAVGGDDARSAEWFDYDYKLRDDSMTITLSGSESFTISLDIRRDAFGLIDVNNTVIAERGKLAFDHAKVLAYLIEALSRDLSMKFLLAL